MLIPADAQGIGNTVNVIEPGGHKGYLQDAAVVETHRPWRFAGLHPFTASLAAKRAPASRSGRACFAAPVRGPA